MNPIDRQIALVALLDKSPMNIDQIINALFNQGYEITVRTFHRDKDALAERDQIHIVYDKSLSKYRLAKTRLSEALRFKMSLLSMQQLLHKTALDEDRIMPEQTLIANVSPMLTQIVEAIQNKQSIRIKLKTNEDKTKKREGLSLYVKQYETNWYVYLEPLDDKKPAWYRVADIVDVKHKPFDQEWPTIDDAILGMYGLESSKKELTRIHLLIAPEKVEYVCTQQLGLPYKTIKKDTLCQIRLEVKPSPSFIQKLATLSPYIQIKKPKEIKELVREELESWVDR